MQINLSKAEAETIIEALKIYNKLIYEEIKQNTKNEEKAKNLYNELLSNHILKKYQNLISKGN